jgi:hypothetical protein
MEKLGSDIVATVGDAEVKENLKKLSKNLRKIIDLKKHANVMAAIFYVCVIALRFVCLMIISHSFLTQIRPSLSVFGLFLRSSVLNKNQRLLLGPGTTTSVRIG